MNQFFIKILSFLEYLSGGKILIIFEENVAITQQFMKIFEENEDDVIIIDSINNLLQKNYSTRVDIASQLAQEILRLYRHIQDNSDSSEDTMEVLIMIFYIFSKRFPFYYKNGVISWMYLYRDFSFFDPDNREMRNLIRQFPQSIEYIKQENGGEEDISELISKVEIEAFAGFVITVISSFNVWKFLIVRNNFIKL